MPLPLPKLIKISKISVTTKEIDIVSKRKRSTSALYCSRSYSGQPNSPLFKSEAEVYDHMKDMQQIDEDFAGIMKLHIVGDSELISKINKKFSV